MFVLKLMYVLQDTYGSFIKQKTVFYISFVKCEKKENRT